ncbi:hypothetical protein [uncultured Methylobacterium sp.]|uniref:hypothetical protein n=1 Tax=uncultured Methylobacterium sp. TaxID=157278 RepID=UPI0035CC1D70
MSAGTIGAHLDATTLDRFRALAATENRSPSQIVGVALKMMLEMTPGARRAIFAVDGMADDGERAFVAKHIGRAALRAYEDILDARRNDLGPQSGSNHALDTEEAIEVEAVRMCRP